MLLSKKEHDLLGEKNIKNMFTDKSQQRNVSNRNTVPNFVPTEQVVLYKNALKLDKISIGMYNYPLILRCQKFHLPFFSSLLVSIYL
jgi:hypothetical protein